MFRFDRDMVLALVCWTVAWLLWGLAVAQYADAGWQQERAEAVAAVVWHDPCPAGVTVRWSDRMLDGRTAAGYLAWTYPTLADQHCVVYFNVDMPTTWMSFCSVMIHEVGHLAGQEHSPNPRSIMYYAPHLDDARCADRGRPYLEAHGV